MNNALLQKHFKKNNKKKIKKAPNLKLNFANLTRNSKPICGSQ